MGKLTKLGMHKVFPFHITKYRTDHVSWSNSAAVWLHDYELVIADIVTSDIQ